MRTWPALPLRLVPDAARLDEIPSHWVARTRIIEMMIKWLETGRSGPMRA
jgi:hypothetical protein